MNVGVLLGWILAGVGVLLTYAAVKGHNPGALVKGAITTGSAKASNG